MYFNLDRKSFDEIEAEEGNLPKWKGASAVYSKAYRWMEKYGYNKELRDLLAEGNENDIKAFFIYTSYAYEK